MRASGLARWVPFCHPGAWGCLGLLVLGVGLETLALPPGPMPWAVLVADAPFIWLLFRGGNRRWKRWALLYGALRFAVALRWLGEVHPMIVLAAALALSPIWLLHGGALRLLVRWRLPFVAGVGVLAVAQEMLQSVWLGGMPWPSRALAFAGEESIGAPLRWLVPAASLFGAYAFAFLSASTSALVSGLPRLLDRGPKGFERRRTAFAGGVWLSLAAVAVLGLAAGLRRRGWEEARAPGGRAMTTVGEFIAIQGAIPQELKHSGETGSARAILERHLELTASAVAGAAARGTPVLAVMWPETMVPWAFYDLPLLRQWPGAWENEVAVIQRMAREALGGDDLHLFAGAIYRRGRLPGGGAKGPEDISERDSLFHLRPAWALDLDPSDPVPGSLPLPWEGAAARHDKVRLVPGGETTPFGDWFPILSRVRDVISPIPELEAGAADQEPFRLPAEVVAPGEVSDPVLRLGTVICFDLGFASRCRAWRGAGAQALLNPANYGWFGRSAFRSQVRAMARLRAAETALGIVMAGNTGPTCHFDPLGRMYGRFVVQETEGSEAPRGTAAGADSTTFRPGWASGVLWIDPALTPYARWGDIPWAVLGVGLLGLGLLPRGRAGPRGRASGGGRGENV